MPPKQKVKSQKKKTKKKKDVSGSVEERYRRAALEVDVLQDHLALRSQVTRRAQERREELQGKLQDLQGDLQEERDEKQAIYSEMTRQHQTLEQQSTVRIQNLEGEVAKLREELAISQQALQKLRVESEQVATKKDVEIAGLRNELENIESEYEALMHSCLDQLLSKLSVAEQQWSGQALCFHKQYKQMLKDCGLNPLES
ncbi:coiled-coil domain-containing protein 153 [Bombina bombina]|uniref:coiled-coil domain-containing protein 153 n=1 Tax=Bombina bombina TaxID=8345 RepID=UPI00235AAA86|nr:coiled-coil domain-containing protein 153 [Bombina bombina]XP_053547335.1 coiled-coil domain-containing protein 153 [Bombina bombina]XP_053547336.1 coiled-coil domain-containing protein 153 [Bombina bombina]XP_053547337.1 coiled-coil domain-containing protein 153 [Bombina bombina]XP_053547338.1 coiled-coil domain-containing protein 153 [Bombina bombina]XP_053547339.1 coiled-coil domain-containing protein 153 [Bombina bombina]